MLRHSAGAVADFLRDENGPTAVEYAVMLAMIIGVCMASGSFLGTICRWRFADAAIRIGAP